MSFTLTTSAAIIRKAGAHANATAIASAALLAEISDMAESEVCEAVRFDLIANYSTIAANLKPVISKAVASKAAVEVIGYDPTGYLNSENQLICDILNNQAEKIIGSLKNRGKAWTSMGA